MKCPQCQLENRPGRRFCHECGASLAAACASCGFPNEAGEKFCGGCGKSLGVATSVPSRFAAPENYTPKHLAEKILRSKGALEGERKQVTVLFCDMANSTALAERLGAEAMHTLLSRFFELALGEVHRYEGTINQFLGDGFMALFGAPLAHEDHARRGVLAALAIERVLREREVHLAREAGTVAVRMGLNTGSVVVGAIGNDLRMDYTAVGDTTNLAARLEQLAKAGTILVSEATARLVRRDVILEPIGPIEIRGKSAPVTASRVIGARPRRSPFASGEGRTLSPFVGRDPELAALHNLMRIAEAGQGQVIEIVGEPGVGKSRLLYEFAQSLAGRRVTWLEGCCLSYGVTIPYQPILDILRAGCGIAEGDAAESVAAKLRAGLAEVRMEPTEAAPYLLHLLGVKEGAESVAQLPPDVFKPRTFRILREMSIKGAQSRPIVLVVEDLHWIDKSSEEYLASLSDSLAGVPILLVATARPGARPPWTDKSYATQLTLRPLSSAESLTLARAVAVEELPKPLAETILSKAEGNPFFVEELTRTILERGGDELPDTIHALLAARIDRLPAETKAVLQTAAVVGREFSSRLLDAVWEGGDLSLHLDELEQREFVYERVAPDSRVYAFKHALTQDVAYESLLQEHRRRVHGRVVEAIENLHGTRLVEHVEHLAYHALRGEMWDKAVRYAREAGLKAAGRFANREAVAMFEQALAALEHVPDDRRQPDLGIELRFDLKNALFPLGELRRAIGILDDAERLARAAGDIRRVGWSLMHRCHGHFLVCDLVRARELGRTALDIATKLGDTTLEVGTNYYLGATSFNLGEYPAAVQFLRHSAASVAREAVRERFGFATLPAVTSRAFLAMSLALTGDLAQASVIGAEAVGIAESADHPWSLVLALHGAGVARASGGDFAGAASDLQRGTALCDDWNITLIWPLLAGTLGWVRTLSGQINEGLRLLDESDARARSMGFLVTVAFLQPYLVEAHVVARRLEDAERCAQSALALLRDRATRGYEAMVLRLLGQIAGYRDPPDLGAAEQHYRDAIVLASQLGMRPLVAHCHADLAKLYQHSGKHDHARERFDAATTMYREMDMRFWLEKAEPEWKASGDG